MIVLILLIIMIAIVEILYNILYTIYSQEVLNLNIGYTFNRKSLDLIMDLINAIDYITYGNPSDNEVIKIIQYYEENYRR